MQNALSADFAIREMKESDLEEILAIEKRSFADPWSKKLFRETLAFPDSANFVVQDPTGAIVGYINFYVIAHEAHMLNLAVHPGWRKRGTATQLLAHSIGYLKHLRAEHFYLEVRESNRDAISLYRKFGFEVIGKRKRYYVETNEDALVMRLTCGSLS